MDDYEVTYTDVDDSGEPANQNALDKKAREPKTKMQERFLAMFPGMKRFPGKAEHKRFRDYETKTLSGTDEAIHYRGFFKLSLGEWLKGKNATHIVINVATALNFLENNDKFLEYKPTKKAQEFLKSQKSFGAVAQVSNAKPIGKELGEE